MGKIMMNGKQYGVGGITDASDVKYTSSQTVKGALDELNAGLSNLQWQSMSGYGAYRVGINFIDIHLVRNAEITVNAYSRVQMATISDVVIDFNKICGVALGRSGGNAFPVGVELANNGALSLYNTSNANLTFTEIVGDIRLPIHS